MNQAPISPHPIALVTIYLTYVSAQAAAKSADASERQQRFDGWPRQAT